jgi:hypothetical protein
MGPYLAQLEKTLATLELTDFDAAAAGIARGLARALDGAYGDARELAILAPKYQAALKALRATRESRAANAPAADASAVKLAAY